jgi:hypothetical protein
MSRLGVSGGGNESGGTKAGNSDEQGEHPKCGLHFW